MEEKVSRKRGKPKKLRAKSEPVLDLPGKEDIAEDTEATLKDYFSGLQSLVSDLAAKTSEHDKILSVLTDKLEQVNTSVKTTNENMQIIYDDHNRLAQVITQGQPQTQSPGYAMQNQEQVQSSNPLNRLLANATMADIAAIVGGNKSEGNFFEQLTKFAEANEAIRKIVGANEPSTTDMYRYIKLGVDMANKGMKDIPFPRGELGNLKPGSSDEEV